MLRSLILVLILAFGVLRGNSASAAVWTESNQWSSKFESRFSAWVRAEWQKDFFSRKTLPNGRANPYYGLRLDCADTVYSMRIIFAYENRLPFVIKDPTSSTGTLSNRMSRWDSQPEHQRIRNFLLYMFDMVSTRSLPSDTYPIAISRDTVRAGSLILTTVKNHHSWTVKEMLSIGIPHLIFNSTIGATSGSILQERQSWPNPEWIFEDNYSPSGHAGFRYWRPTAYLLSPVWEVPGYSEEQYKIGLGKWVRYVQSRLATKRESDESMLARLTNTACEELVQRIGAVRDGVNYLSRNPRCMTYEIYDTYSTPSRDERSFDALMTLRKSYREILENNGGRDLGRSSTARMNKIFPYISSSASKERDNMDRQSITEASVCVVEYRSGRKMDLAEFKRRLFAGLISNNPHDGAEYRWGESRGQSDLARNCQSWDAWSPKF